MAKSSKKKQLKGQYIVDFDYDGNVALVPLENLSQWKKWILTADTYPVPPLPDYVVPVKPPVLSSIIINDPILAGKDLVA